MYYFINKYIFKTEKFHSYLNTVNYNKTLEKKNKKLNANFFLERQY